MNMLLSKLFHVLCCHGREGFVIVFGVKIEAK